ncbi:MULTISPECIES: hypothetical protein [unclassified Streptomyces]|jgi:hypothetical protein|uniref:hypothetical protein n=1 Tax=unclassified Streptomyces TaxID=2593676 RepID=UPI00277FEF70|nr:hypothetical protein [Streptomyces sp. V1I6]MDQ0843831.1 hypothetical protein [Streptomyces sp. V1I6]
MSSIRQARAGAGLRLLRAAVFTAVCVVLSGTGHVLAACRAVPLWTLALGLLGVFVVVLPFTGRERSLPAIAGVLTAGQLALHTLFATGQGHLRLAPTADDALIRLAAKLVCGAGASAMSPAEARRIVTMAGIDPAAHTAHTHTAQAVAAPELLPSLPMVLGHLLAAVATGLLMRRGDAALSRLIRLSAESAHEIVQSAWLRPLRAALALVRALRAGLQQTPGAGPGLAAPVDGPPLPGAGQELQHTVIRRGPPPVFVLSA